MKEIYFSCHSSLELVWVDGQKGMLPSIWPHEDPTWDSLTPSKERVSSYCLRHRIITILRRWEKEDTEKGHSLQTALDQKWHDAYAHIGASPSWTVPSRCKVTGRWVWVVHPGRGRASVCISPAKGSLHWPGSPATLLLVYLNSFSASTLCFL